MVTLHHTSLLDVPIVSSGKSDVLLFIKESITNKKSFTIFTPNPEILVKAKSNARLFSILHANIVNIPDGEGISLFTGIPVIKGRILMEDLFAMLNELKKSIYIVGSTTKVIQKSIEKITVNYPLLTVDGSTGPDFDSDGNVKNESGKEIQENIEKTIRTSKPEVVFVALGAPKQEYWVEKMSQKFPQTSFMVVGGALDTFSGVKPLPPKLFQSIKLEWLFRLLYEPKRFVRIIYAVIVFPLLVLRSKFLSS